MHSLHPFDADAPHAVHSLQASMFTVCSSRGGAEGEIRIRGDFYNFPSLRLLPVTDTTQLSLADRDLQLFATIAVVWADGPWVQILFVSVAGSMLMLTRRN